MARSGVDSLDGPIGYDAQPEEVEVDGTSRDTDVCTTRPDSGSLGIDSTPAYAGILRPPTEGVPRLSDQEFALIALGRSLI